LKFHPDVNPEIDANGRFVEIANCYEIFSDEASRAHYDYCMDYGDYIHYEETPRPKSQQKNSKDSTTPSNLLAATISALTRIYSNNFKQGTRKRKKFLKNLCCLLLFCAVFLLLILKVPFVDRAGLIGFKFLYQLHGGSILYLTLMMFWGSNLVYFIARKICYWVGILSLEDDLEDFLFDLREKIDTHQEKLLREANENKKSKEDDLKLSEEDEREQLERFHGENTHYLEKEKREKREKNNSSLESKKKSQKEMTAEKNKRTELN